MDKPRSVNLIDTHSHMYLPAFDEDREACMERALEAGVVLTALPNIDRSTVPAMQKMMAEYPDQVIGMMGLHPSSVKEDFEAELEAIKAELDGGAYRAIGEIGIDLYWDKTFQAEQTTAFRTQIGWAKDKGLPIVIHARDSFAEICEVLEEEHDERLTGVFHCFTGSVEDAKRALGFAGFYLGIGGVVTFKNSGLDETLKVIGPDRLVLETDAPYLTPHPHRGKRNQTAYTALVAEKLAAVCDRDIDELADITTANARRLFQLDQT